MSTNGAAQRLAETVGVRPDYMFINSAEVQRESWSFGKGVAQLVPQAETK
jgi:hypothetical protein